MRASSFQRPVDLAVSREIDSKYDVIKHVSEHIDQIDRLIGDDDTNLAAIATLAPVANDIASVTEGAKLIRKLDVEMTTLDANQQATIQLVSDSVTEEYTMKFAVPKGTVGEPGFNGLTPQYAFNYNEDTGMLESTLTGYLTLAETEDTTQGEE